jgi:predicted site-specific integrase-resolvase
MDIKSDPSQWPFCGSTKTWSELLGVCTKTLQRWMKDGKLNGRKKGALLFFTKNDVLEMLGLEDLAQPTTKE